VAGEGVGQRHEWVKRQATSVGLGYEGLHDGFAGCPDPERLQAVCDSFSPQHGQAFFDRGIVAIPTPLRTGDRLAGYWWELSMRQLEVSRTQVLDDRAARARASRRWCRTTSASAAPRRSRRVRPPAAQTDPPPYGTRILSTGTEEHGRALRVETVINEPSDLDVPARLHHLPEPIAKARAVDQRLLMIERAGQSCAIGSALFERIHEPYNREGQRTGALRFGDQRAIALAGTLCHILQAVTGFTDKSLRGLVAAYLGQDYSTGKMSYDLRRLRLHGLTQRLPRNNTTS
jgi:hypothetical protein